MSKMIKYGKYAPLSTWMDGKSFKSTIDEPSINKWDAKFLLSHNSLELLRIGECLIDELQGRYLFARSRLFSLLEDYRPIFDFPLWMILQKRE